MIRLGPRQMAVSAIALAFTVALLAWFLSDPGVRDRLGPALADARWSRLLAAIGLLAGVQWLRAWRFNLLVFGAGRLPSWRLVRISAQLTALNFLLPFRLGEISFPLLMKRSFALDLMRGTGVLALARLLDLAVVGTLVAALAAVLVPTGQGNWGTGALAGVALAGAGASVLLALAGAPVARIAAGLPALGSAASRLAHGFDALKTPGAGSAAWALSWAIWLVFGVAAWLAAGAVEETLPLSTAMLAAAAGNLAFALPVNGIVGLGPAQAAWVAAATAVGQPFAEAAIDALALHAAAVIAALGFGGVATAIPARTRPVESADQP